MEIQGSNFILEEFLGFWSNLRNLPSSEDKLEHIGNIYNASPASACFLVSAKYIIVLTYKKKANLFLISYFLTIRLNMKIRTWRYLEPQKKVF